MTDPPDSAALSDPAAAAPAAGRLGLVLLGGGARGAYQVGVLKAIVEMLPTDAPSPFRIISGTSAGAISAAVIASHAQHLRCGAVNLERVWRNFHVDQVFRADTRSMLRSGMHWLLALLSGGWLARSPRSVFDNTPLRELLERHVNFARIRQALDHGHLDALAINASAYRSALSVAFYSCARDVDPWQHAGRDGTLAELGLDHLMASSAVPFMFPPVYMNGEFYGDGAMRETSPLAPAINLGADRLLIVGVRPPAGSARLSGPFDRDGPTFGQLFGFMLDTLFADGLQADLERVERDNLLIASVGTAGAGLRRVRALHLAPQDDLGSIAERHADEMPRPLRVLLRTIGAANPGGRTLLSYLLFEAGYTRELIALGYADGLRQREQIHELLLSEP